MLKTGFVAALAWPLLCGCLASADDLYAGDLPEVGGPEWQEAIEDPRNAIFFIVDVDGNLQEFKQQNYEVRDAEDLISKDPRIIKELDDILYIANQIGVNSHICVTKKTSGGLQDVCCPHCDHPQ